MLNAPNGIASACTCRSSSTSPVGFCERSTTSVVNGEKRRMASGKYRYTGSRAL
jgi:hypothetical protein